MGVFEAPEQSRMIFEEKRKYSNFNENYKATDPRRQGQLPISCEYQALSHDFFQGFFFFLSRAFKDAHIRTAGKMSSCMQPFTGQADMRLPDFSSDSVFGPR